MVLGSLPEPADGSPRGRGRLPGHVPGAGAKAESIRAMRARSLALWGDLPGGPGSARRSGVAAGMRSPTSPSPPAFGCGSRPRRTEEVHPRGDRAAAESFRPPIILCCLQGLSYDLAARGLGLASRRSEVDSIAPASGWRRGSVAWNPHPGPRAVESRPPSTLPLPDSLVETTIQLASRWSSVRGLLVGAAAVPESIATLARGVIHAMILQTVRSPGSQPPGRGPPGDSGRRPAGKTPGDPAKATPPAAAPSLVTQPGPRDLQRRTQEILPEARGAGRDDLPQ